MNETSLEELQHILDRLKRLGGRGERILSLLKKQALAERKSDEPFRKTTVPVVDMNTNYIETGEGKPAGKHHNGTAASPMKTSNTIVDETNESREQRLNREKRELIIRTALVQELNGDEEEKENVANEEVFHSN